MTPRLYFFVSTMLLSSTIAFASNPAASHGQELSLPQAILLAQQADHWQTGSRMTQRAAVARGEAADTLPNPTLSISALNLPTDHWHFRQEGMSQLQLGVAQRFPRGDSRSIRQQIWQTQASKEPLLRQNRNALLQRWITELWLDAYASNQAITLISRDRSLFEQINELATASYASAVGSVRQRDIIRAQLEITQLDDRLLSEQQRLHAATATLSRWLPDTTLTPNYSLALDALPELPALSKQHLQLLDTTVTQSLVDWVMQHPAVAVFDTQKTVAQQKVTLAEQSYKSQWTVNAAYGLRSDSQDNMSRADLFSVGVSFDLPLFNQQRQDANVQAAIAEASTVETEKRLMIQQLISEIRADFQRFKHLQQRKTIYDQRLLAQLNEQAESALTAYTNDDGGFAEVVRARIAELDARLTVLQLQIDTLNTISRIQYGLTQVTTSSPEQSKERQ